ncbi:MAG: hypothetical protein LAQ30_14310 [Acidobacteriia bacterium]|nr:hypothetical protein [Terriglobia bacterium]
MIWALAALCTAQAAPPEARALPARVAVEAELFQQNAPRTLSLETLEQRSVASSRGRIRVGAAATGSAKPRIQIRKVVSEYTLASLAGSDSRALVEFRQVVSVDDRPVQSLESARRTLSLGLQSRDERVRKRMLEEFARHGLVDVATDYGTILLSFTSRGQESLEILPSGEERIGADDALVFTWRQTSPQGGELLFAGREVARRPLEGALYVRKSDGLPLRVRVWAVNPLTAGHTIRDEATIDYVMSAHGFLTPASVRHQHIVDGALRTENLYRYETFRLFGADTRINFSPIQDQPSAK